MEKGKLFVVATPIGNLKDITIRALEVLKEVNVILSEDTRETDKLLRYYDITSKHQLSYRDQNHDRVIGQIVSILEKGENIALVTDSGTPVISDPGFKLVRDLSTSGFEVIAVPGASMLSASVSISGLPSDKVVFLGFLPRVSSQRKKILEQYGALDATLVIYESPFRVEKLLNEACETLGNRKACLINDLTKMYEKVDRYGLFELQNKVKNSKLKGEFALLIAKEKY